VFGHAPDHFRNFIAKICNQWQWRGPRHARADQHLSSTGTGQQSRVLVSRDEIIERVLVRHAGCDWAGDRLSGRARHCQRALGEGEGGRPARSGRLKRVPAAVSSRLVVQDHAQSVWGGRGGGSFGALRGTGPPPCCVLQVAAGPPPP